MLYLMISGEVSEVNDLKMIIALFGSKKIQNENSEKLCNFQ